MRMNFKPNTQVTDMTEQQMEDAMALWYPDLADAALREGWLIADSRGSEAGPIQVQRIDDPESVEDVDFPIPFLSGDDHAMRIVIQGQGLHHQQARMIICLYNPEDYERMLNLVNHEGKPPNA